MQNAEKIAHALLKESRQEKQVYNVAVLHKLFVVYPHVFSPKYFDDTEFFARNLPIKRGVKMLEVGTGTGAVAISSVFRGAKQVLATDINPYALKNARENVKLYDMDDKITVIKSDLFNRLNHKRFDLIFFNAPFCYTERKNLTMLERALFDYNYLTVCRFISNLKFHLRKDGRAFLGFSSSFGDLQRLREIAERDHYRLRIIRRTLTKRKHKSVRLELIEILPR